MRSGLLCFLVASILTAVLGCAHYVDNMVAGVAIFSPPGEGVAEPILDKLPVTVSGVVIKTGDVRWRITSNAAEAGPTESSFFGIEMPGETAQSNKHREVKSKFLEIEVYVVSLSPGIEIINPTGVLVFPDGKEHWPVKMIMNVPEFDGVRKDKNGFLQSVRIPLVSTEVASEWSGRPKFRFLYNIQPDPYRRYLFKFGEISGNGIKFMFSPHLVKTPLRR